MVTFPFALVTLAFGQINFSALKLAWPLRPTMMWSCTVMPSGFAIPTISFVMTMSAAEGRGSPEGWLWRTL